MAHRKRLLSVDWDYFTVGSGSALAKINPLLYDWGHSESWTDGLQGFLWATRAEAFDRYKLARPTTSGDEADFWKRFTFAPHARLMTAVSHSTAAHPALFQFGRYGEIWNYDAHHDCGYRDEALSVLREMGIVTCENWMLAYREFRQPVKLHVRYPRWKVDAFTVECNAPEDVDRAFDDGSPAGRFDDVLIVRSDSWTPPWLDAQFEAFVQACPAKGPRLWLEPPEKLVAGTLLPRVFSEDDVQRMKESFDAASRMRDVPA